MPLEDLVQWSAAEVRFWAHERMHIETRMTREEYLAGLLNALELAERVGRLLAGKEFFESQY